MTTKPRIDLSRDDVERQRRLGRSWSEIADEVGCSVRTIKRRAKEWGLSEKATEAVEAAAAQAGRVAAAKWILRRAEEADRAGIVATSVRMQLVQLLPLAGMPIVDKNGQIVGGPQESGLTIYRLARTYEILIKNAQLLSGGATERTEQSGEDALNVEYRALVAEMEALGDDDEPRLDDEPAAEPEIAE